VVRCGAEEEDGAEGAHRREADLRRENAVQRVQLGPESRHAARLQLGGHVIGHGHVTAVSKHSLVLRFPFRVIPNSHRPTRPDPTKLFQDD